MPTKQQHQKQIESNEAFYKDLNSVDTFKQKYFDWRITTLFYIIVHYANALCADKGVLRFEKHREREEELQKHLNPSELNLYRKLKNASRHARYDVKCLDSAALNYWQNVYKNYYYPLRKIFQQKIT